MPKQLFGPGNSGRPKGAKNKRTAIKELFEEKEINQALKDDFVSGDKFVRQFVYEHWYGKAANINKNEHNIPTAMKLVIG